MKKIVNIIQKTYKIKNRLMGIVRNNKDKKDKHHNHGNHDIELDGHNDSSNWTYN
jgi:hypothetical protein